MSSPGVSFSVRHEVLTSVTGMIMIGAIVVLFIAVIFVGSLHLHSRRQRATRSSQLRGLVVNAHAEDAFGGVSTPRKGLDAAIVASLPVLVFSSKELKGGLECSVCLCEVDDGEKARLLPNCGHGFHLDCIDMWFHSHSTCPLCRNVVAAGPDIESPPEFPAHNPDHMQRLNFPTNVLFWGNNDGEVNTRVTRVEEASSSSAPSSNAEEDETGHGVGREEVKSPAARFRSLKRLLSREPICTASCDPGNGDIEQGFEGSGHC